MSDDDPFADLGETLTDDDPADPENSREVSESSTAERGGGSSGDAESDRDDPVAEADTEHDPSTDAAFTYHDADQRPFYARPETIDEFDSWLNYELERDLHDRGYQNIAVREMTDALLRTVVEEGLLDEVARRFERAREGGSDP